MVTRIATASANTALVQRMLEQQVTVNNDQTQVSTGFKSQDYTGIAGDSFQLLDIENERARLQRYLSNNALTNTTLQTQQQAVTGISDAASTFQNALIQFSSQDLSSKSPNVVSSVADIQQKAFGALSQIQYFLNQQVDGRYIFGGANSALPPVSLPYDNLTSFQNFYDGVNTVFPSSRVANMVNINLDNITANYTNTTVPSTSLPVTQVKGSVGNFVTQSLDQTQTGNLIFSNVGSNGVITAATPGAFKSMQVGQTIMINNSASAQGGATATDNNGVYTITAVSPDGNSITLDQSVNAGTELAADNVNINLTVPNGTTLALSGSTAGNNGPYTVVWPSNADLAAMGFNMNGSPPDLVAGDSIFTSKQIPVNAASGETISLDSKAFLQGTNLTTSTRVSDTQSIQLDVTALDPAFEKAIRALGEIAQGDLIDHPERVKQALATINDAINHSPLEPTEATSDLQNVQDRIANNMATIKNTNDIQNSFLAFLEGRQNDLSKADTTEAAVRLQTDSQSLQISFASIAKISQLSLLNYL